jgi:hypothetical protein
MGSKTPRPTADANSPWPAHPMNTKLVSIQKKGIHRLKCVSNWRSLTLAIYIVFSCLRQVFAMTAIPSYKVQGHLEIKSIRYSQASESYYYTNYGFGFDVTVNGSNWLMTLGTRDPMLYDYRIVSSDGVDSYLLLDYDTRQKINTNTINYGDGLVIKGNVPCFLNANEAGTIWLEYASSAYFSEHSRDERIVVPYCNYVKYFSIDPGKRLAYEQADLALSDQTPRVPIAMSYYFHPIFPNKKEPLWEMSTNLSNDFAFTNIIYSVLSFTNANGLSLPKDVASSMYRPYPGSLTNLTPQLCEEVHLTITNIMTNVVLASFKPKLPGYTCIYEARITNNNGDPIPFELYATNNWPSEATARRSKAYQDAWSLSLSSNVAVNENTRKSPFVIALLIVCTIGLPLGLWFFTRKSGDQ